MYTLKGKIDPVLGYLTPVHILAHYFEGFGETWGIIV